MSFLWMLIVGLIAGALAKLVMPGRQGGGMIITMLLGMAGALIAGALGHAVGWYHTGDEGPGILAATVGALIVLVAYGAITRRRGLTH